MVKWICNWRKRRRKLKVRRAYQELCDDMFMERAKEMLHDLSVYGTYMCDSNLNRVDPRRLYRNGSEKEAGR